MDGSHQRTSYMALLAVLMAVSAFSLGIACSKQTESNGLVPRGNDSEPARTDTDSASEREGANMPEVHTYAFHVENLTRLADGSI